MKKLGFGLMRLPMTDEKDRSSIDQEQVNAMVDRFMEAGFTYFDTGYPYHNGVSEVAARRGVVERYPRERFQLADKMPVWLVKSNEDYQRLFDEQLERCGVEYFDYYLLHNLGEKNYADTLEHGGFPFVRKLKEEGRARHIGLSFHDKAALLDRILTEHPEMEFVQLQINYADWEDDSIQARQCYEVAVKHGLPVIVMEPVKGGALAQVPPAAEQLMRAHQPQMSAASWAVRYTASLDGVMMVLSGMSTMEQLEDNMGYMADFRPLSGEERAIVNQVTGIINASIAVPCTSCQYCVEDCPKGIPIPQYFSLYNNQHLFGFVPAHANYYMNLTQNFGKASECISCRRCEEHCPQHIEIARHMAEVTGVFEPAQ